MATVEEMVVVLIYLWVGLTIKSVPEEVESASGGKKLVHRFGRGDFGGGKLGVLSLAAAVIDAFRASSQQEPDRKNEENV